MFLPQSLAVRDTVRECLEKDPSDRTEDDIETLLEFTKNLRAFTNMTLAVRRALCAVMVFAVVEKAGTLVMSNGEELDSWSVLINGHIEIVHSNDAGQVVAREELQVGDSFGILPTMVKLYHRGVMRTKCHDCQFVCITQTDYYRIHHQGEENTQKHEEDGQLVMVTELRHGATDGGQRRGHVVIRGTPERLLLQLIEENSMTDPTYVEDFLLTHRTFTESAPAVAQRLLNWFDNETTQPQPTQVTTISVSLSLSFCSSLIIIPLVLQATPSEIRDRVTRVVLLWVNNHFPDFETDPQMMEFLETFEAGLERKSMHGHLRLLHIACAAKARQRTVTLARSARDEPLQFSIVGGYERGGYGIFIAAVDKRSKPEDRGLKRGDQILEVNGHSFEHVTNARALELLTSTTHLSITVKSNLLEFKEMLAAAAEDATTDSPRPRHGRRKAMADIAKLTAHQQQVVNNGSHRFSTIEFSSHDQTDNLTMASPQVAGKYVGVKAPKDGKGSGGGGGFMTGTLGPKKRLQKALIKMSLLPKNAVSLLMDGALIGSTQDEDAISASSSNACSQSASGSVASNSTSGSASSLYQSHSNPDLPSATAAAAPSLYDDSALTATASSTSSRHSDYPEHVLKVYRSDQTCKYLLVHKETTAHEVVMLALQEFGCHESSSKFCLCEVSVGEGGMIKQRRLPEQLQNLAERIGLAARYYLKMNEISETLVPDEMAPDLVRDAAVHFLQLNANELAIQLTFQDFSIFRQIESTEYVDDLFTSSSSSSSSNAAAASCSSNSDNAIHAAPNQRYGTPLMLHQFAELVNREMFWVVTEVCSEPNLVRRSKILKQFVKIARHCKECKNFNSMFAIVSGLGHAAVSRLRLTWEKLPGKYQRLFSDLQELMDPSRNMSKYRQLVSAELHEQHPIIPFYPVVKKDLTFIHLGNDTLVEGLINFEKLRMIAKEVRSLTHMCSSDLLQMLELKGQPPSLAMVALNQMQMAGGGNAAAPGGGTTATASSSSGMSSYFAMNHGGGQATVKRRKKSTAAPNPKKMFEEAQMVRRVKAYLNNMKVTTDEDQLHRLSIECEPPVGGGSGSGGGGGAGGSMSSSSSAPNTVIIRKRHPSPTLSTTSSTSSASEGKKGAIALAAAAAAAAAASNTGPKFGTASPQAVKKILSLSETNKTRPHQPRQPAAAIVGGSVPLSLNLSLAQQQQQQQQLLLMGHHHPHHHHGPLHHLLGSSAGSNSGGSPSPSPGAHRRIGSSSSAG